MQSWRVLQLTGQPTAFNRDKLFLSLYESCRHRPNALEEVGLLVDTVLKRLLPLTHEATLTPVQIAEVSAEVLRRFDHAAYVSYRAYYPVSA